MRNVGDAIGGALVMAAASTLGDFVWATWSLRDRPVFGLTHGALLFLCMGLYLGGRAHKPVVGALVGALVGIAAAGAFYLLAPLAGYSVMFVLWIGVWIGLGLLNGRLLQKQGSVREVLIRSILAAVTCGVAFYAVSGIWFPFRPHGWDYAVHFVSWTVAYWPGFAALLVSRPSLEMQPRRHEDTKT